MWAQEHIERLVRERDEARRARDDAEQRLAGGPVADTETFLHTGHYDGPATPYLPLRPRSQVRFLLPAPRQDQEDSFIDVQMVYAGADGPAVQLMGSETLLVVPQVTNVVLVRHLDSFMGRDFVPGSYQPSREHVKLAKERACEWIDRRIAARKS